MTEPANMASLATKEDVMEDDDIEMEEDRLDGLPSRKRRRAVKPNLEKKFECKHEGCGKSYSRAEHLYRHQLNHTPKAIYRCDYPDCNRYFVRQDLCVRHRERHTTHGSQLHKRDTSSNSATNSQDIGYDRDRPGAEDGIHGSGSIDQQSRGLADAAQSDYGQRVSDHYTNSDTTYIARLSGSGGSYSTSSTDRHFQPPTPQRESSQADFVHQRANSSGSNPLSPIQKQSGGFWAVPAKKESFSNRDPQSQQPLHRSNVPSITDQSPSRSYSISSTSTNHPLPQQNASMEQPGFMAHTNEFALQPNLQQSMYSTNHPLNGVSRATNVTFATAVSDGLNGIKHEPYLQYPNTGHNMPSIDMNAACGYPVFGGDGSTFAMGDDFTSWLFNDGQLALMGSSNTFMPTTNESPITQIQGPYFNNSPVSNTYSNNSLAMQQSMHVNDMLDASSRSNYIMSEEKRQELLDLMQTQFIERPHDAVKKRKDSVFEGDVDSDGHILCLRMMHTYIGSYWYHQHAQLPILHKSTFCADKTPNLLLLAVIAIGAATLDKAYGTSLTDSAAEFANFVAWHIRWEIMRDADFRPPAKLWVFQALLLIEVYEKMYATRALHERSHIHHDTTLTLMRRGSSLLGRSASDSPPSMRDDYGGKPGSRAGTASDASKSEDSWYRWIATEATRRAAFGAFVLDSLHATMFGHSAKMVAHEMRLPLPCDEGLWSAVSPAEAGRVQSSLQTNGIKPIMFLEGLKKTLNGERVRTNSFGRTIIMAGLLSVSWHMTQRDLQINSLGARTVQTFGGPDKWKGALLRAFDNWKRDFDEALAEATPLRPSDSPSTARPDLSSRSNSLTAVAMLRPVDDENIFESRTVLHHLAHIAAHVDVVDCQVFAGANRLLGRSITPKDYSTIREKMIERWATKASARDAAFYALKFLAQVLVPRDYDRASGENGWRYGHASPILPQAFDERDMYIARDDFLLNRPWVLYISALVVWCYGFALEGPIQPVPRDEDFASYEQKDRDMRAYLERVAGVRAPDDLEAVQGKNSCLGLLMLLRESFYATRWELTHEAAGLLGNCAGKLMGKVEGDGRRMAGG